MSVPHPIPYQGSKRNLAPAVLSYFPSKVHRVFEPFAGSAAISLAFAANRKVNHIFLNDINAPLVELWREIIENPKVLAGKYRTLWESQLGREREYYDSVRDDFNATGRPEHLLYLLARCVKAAIRYNSRGQFNQSPDNRRLGMRPPLMETHILGASALLRNVTTLTAADYRDVLSEAGTDDLVYLDPPYQGVSANRDARYIRGVRYGEFVAALGDLNRRGIAYILSYDGSSGGKVYGLELPESLELKRIDIAAGVSTQATLLGRRAITTESLYLSPALTQQIDFHVSQQHSSRQLALGVV